MAGWISSPGIRTLCAGQPCAAPATTIDLADPSGYINPGENRTHRPAQTLLRSTTNGDEHAPLDGPGRLGYHDTGRCGERVFGSASCGASNLDGSTDHGDDYYEAGADVDPVRQRGAPA